MELFAPSDYYPSFPINYLLFFTIPGLPEVGFHPSFHHQKSFSKLVHVGAGNASALCQTMFGEAFSYDFVYFYPKEDWFHLSFQTCLLKRGGFCKPRFLKCEPLISVFEAPLMANHNDVVLWHSSEVVLAVIFQCLDQFWCFPISILCSSCIRFCLRSVNKKKRVIRPALPPL